MTTETETEMDESRKYLLNVIEPGDIIYTICHHTSQSGMTRHISCYIARKKEIINITYYVSKLLGYRRNNKDGGIVIRGCGMDMGYSIVYNIGRVLWSNGFRCNGKNCPSNEHSNPPYPIRDGSTQHGDGGYALRHSWL